MLEQTLLSQTWNRNLTKALLREIDKQPNLKMPNGDDSKPANDQVEI
tara:strand:+ start:439 stop:579 length:141 start_codon:yes stop_codon:yes gene_type:complete